MEVQLKRRLNAFRFTNETISNLKNCIRNNAVPEKYQGFTVNEKNDLVYQSTGQIVASPETREKIVNDIYKEFGLGSGQNSLYEKVSRRYLNITRVFVREFLKRQEGYQLAYTQRNQTNKKIFSSGINKCWYIDLIDCNPLVKTNKGYRYIVTSVDSFSKFVFLAKLKNKEPASIVTALREICILQANNNYPRVLVSDNGTEFKNQLMEEFSREHDIKQIFGRSYSPKSNALCEATNGVIRNMLRALFIRHCNTNWCDHLEIIRNSINDATPSSTERPRSEVYLQGLHAHEILSKNQVIKTEQQRLNNNEKFNIGDEVRISLLALETKVREKFKSGNSKYVIVRFSKEIYTVDKIIKTKSAFSKDQYKLKDIDGNLLPQPFYFNELRIVKPNTVINQNLTPAKINKLNFLKTNIRPERNVVQLRNQNRNNADGLYWNEPIDDFDF